ncbi:MAG: UDP-3-O-acyl-N-acetylglucosamine deacetylase [Desulfovibrio sp.]|jgi:UDP-3-O-[3-hydroxymyristoyl] N-acetylglucosamine deacetylase|nr:UDP-3-O-acyl-N-acetylglucosamine deacetylase [Desulfovibrio sp.]
MTGASSPAGWNTKQGTLAGDVRITGRGLHTGKTVGVRLAPPRDKKSGIVFRRIRNGEVLASIPASLGRWRQYPLCSTLAAENGLLVRTVEHLLAALLMCEIDRAVVDLDGEEVPILDGGASIWMELLKQCGRVSCASPKRFIRIVRPYSYRFGDTAEYGVQPCAGGEPAYAVDIGARIPGMPPAHWRCALTPALFRAEIAPARTYGSPIWALMALAGGWLSGVPVLRGIRPGVGAALLGGRVLGGMKVPDECLRHRLLDMIGDFALAGAPVLGVVTVTQPSHRRNRKFMRLLLRQPGVWEWAVFD